MTERTVEIEQTETVSTKEKLLICDYCGESGEDGGEMVKYEQAVEPQHNSVRVKNSFKYPPTLHLHHECVDEGLGNLGPRPKQDTSSNGNRGETFLKRVIFGFWGVYSWPVQHRLEIMRDPDTVDVFYGWGMYLFLQFLIIIVLLGV